MTRALSKYLAGHAEEEAKLRPRLARRYRFVVCIPACDEEGTLLETLRNLASTEQAANALAIVVLNASAGAPERVHAANARCAQALRSAAQLGSSCRALGSMSGLDLLLIDRAEPGRTLPPKQGVGLARKIGADVALAWIADGSVETPLIWSTDADVVVPPDYFTRPLEASLDASAFVFPFTHRLEGDASQRAAMRSYDQYLRYYLDGLRRAGSPYAFHTIGSTLCIGATAYAQVRGFPKRQAGEDFYLLNKLAKVGSIVTLTGQPIELSGRISDRVPFGTGAAVRQIQAQRAQGSAYTVENPLVFDALGAWLELLDHATHEDAFEALEDRLEALEAPYAQPLRRALGAAGHLAAARAAFEQCQGTVLRKRLHDWNDAFRTLKLIHQLRDEGLDEVPADEVFAPDHSIPTG